MCRRPGVVRAGFDPARASICVIGSTTTSRESCPRPGKHDKKFPPRWAVLAFKGFSRLFCGAILAGDMMDSPLAAYRKRLEAGDLVADADQAAAAARLDALAGALKE